MRVFGIGVQGMVLLIILLTLSIVIGQDYDDYGRRNRKRRPHNQHTSSGPCGRFLGLTYLNVNNYHVDCGGAGGGSLDDFLGGHVGHGGGHRPQKPHRPFGAVNCRRGDAGCDDHTQGQGSHRPFWGAIGSFASNIGNTVGTFTNSLNDVGGAGGHFFDGSLFNSFAGLFSHSGDGGAVSGIPSRPPAIVTNSQPIYELGTTARPSTTQTISSGFPNIPPHPDVPIVDLRPVHEEYYDEVTEAALYGSTNSKFLNNRYVSGGGHHHSHNGGLFDINYNKAFRKINRNLNQALNYFFKR